MITVTNDAKDFIENQSGEILIYGAGNAGYWVGYYLNRCGIEFSGYIDRNISYQGALYNRKPVFSPVKLKEYKGKNIRLIIPLYAYESVLSDLIFKEKEHNFHALCLVPRYKHFIEQRYIYHINKLLAYFRRKLYIGETPTLICNDCFGGEIYDMMDMLMLSPTINVWIEPEDYAKLCCNPQKYFNYKANSLSKIVVAQGDGRNQSAVMPAVQIEDIAIAFAHVQNTEGLLERWNMMRERINWNHLIFVYRTVELPVPQTLIHTLVTTDKKHLIVRAQGNGLSHNHVNQLFLNDLKLLDYNHAIENVFDVLGWMNQLAGNGTGKMGE